MNLKERQLLELLGSESKLVRKRRGRPLLVRLQEGEGIIRVGEWVGEAVMCDGLIIVTKHAWERSSISNSLQKNQGYFS